MAKSSMSRQSAVNVMAGSFILISLALYYWVSEWCLIITTFVGANLFQYGFSGYCPAATVFGMLGFRDATCSVDYHSTAVTADACVQKHDGKQEEKV